MKFILLSLNNRSLWNIKIVLLPLNKAFYYLVCFKMFNLKSKKASKKLYRTRHTSHKDFLLNLKQKKERQLQTILEKLRKL